MNKNTIILLASIFFVACGGGGSGGAPASTTVPTASNKSFDLTKLQSTTLGTIYSTRLTGSDTSGVKYSGSFFVANRTQTMLNGVLVTPHDLLVSLTGGGSSITVTGTSNIDTSGNLISVVIQTTGLTCTPVSPDSMPDTVKIGDFGILSILTCSDNTTQERNWRIKDAGNGNIHVISNGTIKDQFNTIISITDVTITIDGNGNIIAFKTVSTQSSSNYTLTYQSV